MQDMFNIIVDRAGTAIIKMNSDLVVDYVNKASLDLLEKHQREIKKVYPEFELEKLLGTSLDAIAVIPRETVANLRDPQRSQFSEYIEVGKETVHATIYPIITGDGTDMGTVIEWWHATEYLAGLEHEKKISEIINVIDNLYFQANILSVNAAVEAAHAGDQGRSFGIIAAEMRELSQHSRDATKEIKEYIGKMAHKA